MTMKMTMKRAAQRPAERAMPAVEFKAHCLALLDDVARSGRAIVVSKRGRPVTRVAPLAKD